MKLLSKGFFVLQRKMLPLSGDNVVELKNDSRVQFLEYHTDFVISSLFVLTSCDGVRLGVECWVQL